MAEAPLIDSLALLAGQRDASAADFLSVLKLNIL
jgi:hypothetical protein